MAGSCPLDGATLRVEPRRPTYRGREFREVSAETCPKCGEVFLPPDAAREYAAFMESVDSDRAGAAKAPGGG